VAPGKDILFYYTDKANKEPGERQALELQVNLINSVALAPYKGPNPQRPASDQNLKWIPINIAE